MSSLTRLIRFTLGRRARADRVQHGGLGHPDNHAGDRPRIDGRRLDPSDRRRADADRPSAQEVIPRSWGRVARSRPHFHQRPPCTASTTSPIAEKLVSISLDDPPNTRLVWSPFSARLAGLVALLVIEMLTLTVSFDTGVVIRHGGRWAALLGKTRPHAHDSRCGGDGDCLVGRRAISPRAGPAHRPGTPAGAGFCPAGRPLRRVRRVHRHDGLPPGGRPRNVDLPGRLDCRLGGPGPGQHGLLGRCGLAVGVMGAVATAHKCRLAHGGGCRPGRRAAGRLTIWAWGPLGQSTL